MQGNWKMSQRAHNVDATFLRRRLPVGVNPYILRMFDVQCFSCKTLEKQKQKVSANQNNLDTKIFLAF